MTRCDAQMMSDLSRPPRLSLAEERALYPQWHEPRVRNCLVAATIGLAVRIARRFEGRGIANDELRAEANLALVRAAHKFDPTKAVRFATYAMPGIVGHLKNLFARAVPPTAGGEPDECGTEMPASRLEILDELAAVTTDLSVRDRDVLLARHGRGETYEAIAGRHRLSIEGVRKIEVKAMAVARAAAGRAG